MYFVVLDASSLIPSDEKFKEAIQRLGEFLYKNPKAVVCLSVKLIKLYQTKVYPLLRRYHPLPPLQVSLYNLQFEFKDNLAIAKGRSL